LTRETIQYGWKFPTESDSLSIPEADKSANESSDPGEEYGEPESDETEPGSTSTWDHRFERIDRVQVRASQNRRESVLEVHASIHDFPIIHSDWDEIAWIESCKQERIRARKEKERMRAEDRLQEKHDAEVHRKWIFPRPCAKRCGSSEQPIGPDGFLFQQSHYDRQGMNDLCHAYKPRDIYHSGDRAMTIGATSSMLLQFDESIVGPLSLLRMSLYRGCIKSGYGPGVSRFRAIKYWACHFEEGNRGLEDEPRPGHLLPTECDDSICFCLVSDPYVSYPHVAGILSIYQGTVRQVL
jgi:hypothetical protein